MLDGRQLSHALSLFALGIELPQDRIQEVFLPAAGYRFQVGEIVSDFVFDVDVEGRIVLKDVDSQIVLNDPRFAQVTGRTLTISGFQVTIDGRQLSHALSLFALGIELPQDRSHELSLIPAAGYRFQVGQIVSDFVFDVDVMAKSSLIRVLPILPRLPVTR